MLLKLDEVTKSFGGYSAVNEVSLSVKQGEIHAIIGPNGAGKTTLLNLISGVLAPTKGTIHLNGTNVTNKRPDRLVRLGLARTFQGVRLFQSMSALENVQAGQFIRNGYRFLSTFTSLPGRTSKAEKASRDAAMELLDLVGLTTQHSVLSGDMALADQRRLEIARALASEPQLLLLDEPVAGMNPTEVNSAAQLIQKLGERGITVLLIEHHMSLVMEISDTISVLNYGQKIAEGSPAEIRSNPLVLEAYLGSEVAARTPSHATAPSGGNELAAQEAY